MSAQKRAQNVYEALGIRTWINTIGGSTTMGGSRYSPTVLAAFNEANAYWVDMDELLEKSGGIIADIVGAEAAHMTCGTFAAMVLGCAAILVGSDPEKIVRLPDTTGLKNEFVLQKPDVSDYVFDRCVTMVGGKLIEVEVADDLATTEGRIEAAIGPQTAALFYLCIAPHYSKEKLPLSTVVAIAKRHGLPVLVDAAGVSMPAVVESTVATGADIICFGGKYFGSANSTGFACGKKDWILAIREHHDFLAFHTRENRNIGRGMKLDPQDIVATVFALREWWQMDMSALQSRLRRNAETIAGALADLSCIKLEIATWSEGPWCYLWIDVDEARLEKTIPEMQAELKAKDPGILTNATEGRFWVNLFELKEPEVEIVAQRFRKVLSR